MQALALRCCDFLSHVPAERRSSGSMGIMRLFKSQLSVAPSILRQRLICCAGSGNSIEPPNVTQLAQMAQLALTDEEIADWEPKLLEIVKWFDQLQAVQTEGVTPAGRVIHGPTDRSRADCPEAYADRAELLEAVPEMEGPLVKVPRIL